MTYEIRDLTKARRYISRIQNPEKQRYAWHWLMYLRKRAAVPNDAHYSCGSMAKQAVRLELNEIFEAEC